MPFLLLLCLLAVCLPLDWPAPPAWVGRDGSLLLTSLLTIALLLASSVIAQRARYRLPREPDARERIGQQYGTARTWFFFVNLFSLGVCLLVFGWGDAATELGSITYANHSFLIPGGELLRLAPFLIVQIGSWCFYFDADREFHALSHDPLKRDQFWTRREYVLFLFRQQLILVFAPLILLMAQQGVERAYPEILQQPWLPFASLMVLPTFLIFFPLLLPTLLGLRSLPAGPIRDRFEANARRLEFRYSRLYLWDTRNNVANAMVVGIIPWIRYVVFTDRLLDELADSEVDAVFGHEIGHARHGHMLYYALFLMLSFVLMGGLVQIARMMDFGPVQEMRTLFQVAPVVFLGAYMFIAFGFISRRCERQADVFGSRAGSCSSTICYGHDATTILPPRGEGLCTTGIESFIGALRRVEDINGMTRAPALWRGTGVIGKLNWVFRLLTGWLHTWQHSTIPKRIAFLERIAREPEVERRFQRRVWMLRCAILLALVGSLVGLALWQGWGILLLAM